DPVLLLAFPTRRSSDLARSLQTAAPDDKGEAFGAPASHQPRVSRMARSTAVWRLLWGWGWSLETPPSFNQSMFSFDHSMAQVRPDRKSTRLNSSHVKIA